MNSKRIKLSEGETIRFLYLKRGREFNPEVLEYIRNVSRKFYLKKCDENFVTYMFVCNEESLTFMKVKFDKNEIEFRA